MSLMNEDDAATWQAGGPVERVALAHLVMSAAERVRTASIDGSACRRRLPCPGFPRRGEEPC